MNFIFCHVNKELVISFFGQVYGVSYAEETIKIGNYCIHERYVRYNIIYEINGSIFLAYLQNQLWRETCQDSSFFFQFY